MLVLFVTVLLVGTVFGIVHAVTSFATVQKDEQRLDARQAGLSELFRRTFQNLPAEAFVRLRNRGGSGSYEGELAIAHAPSMVASAAGGVSIWELQRGPDGYARLLMRILSREQVLAWEGGDRSVGSQIVMIEGLSRFEWRFYNDVSQEWEPLWNEKLKLPDKPPAALAMPEVATLNPGSPSPDDKDKATDPEVPGLDAKDGSTKNEPEKAQVNIPRAQTQGKRPSLIELIFAQIGGEPQRRIFWVPPLQ